MNATTLVVGELDATDDIRTARRLLKLDLSKLDQLAQGLQ
jgi:hypothetical protein